MSEANQIPNLSYVVFQNGFGTHISQSHTHTHTHTYIQYIQVKKKAFKINAKIEDVGLNED